MTAGQNPTHSLNPHSSGACAGIWDNLSAEPGIAQMILIAPAGDHALVHDTGRRIASNIAKLPTLLARKGWAPAPLRRKGFGSTILIDAAKSFGSDANFTFDPEGLSYSVRLPIRNIEIADSFRDVSRNG